MIIPLPALAAYRRDLESLGHAVGTEPELDTALGAWVSFGSILESFLAEVAFAAQKNGTDTVEHLLGTYGVRLAAAAETRHPTAHSASTDSSTGHPHDLAGLAALTRRVADAAEQRGALWLAYAMLASLERVGDAMCPLELGRLLAQRARVARKADSSDVADVLYRRVDALGRSADLPELRRGRPSGSECSPSSAAICRSPHGNSRRLPVSLRRLAKRIWSASRSMVEW
jgi:hypothetical protein